MKRGHVSASSLGGLWSVALEGAIRVHVFGDERAVFVSVAFGANVCNLSEDHLRSWHVQAVLFRSIKGPTKIFICQVSTEDCVEVPVRRGRLQDVGYWIPDLLGPAAPRGCRDDVVKHLGVQAQAGSQL